MSSTAFDELLARVASEPERVISAIVSSVPPDLVAVATQRGGLSLDELLSSSGRTSNVARSGIATSSGRPRRR